MSTYGYSLVTSPSLIRFQGTKIRAKAYLNPLIKFVFLLGSLSALSCYILGRPTVNIFGELLNLMFLAASIGVFIAICLAIFIVAVDSFLVTLKIAGK
jgi:hypothetical protein